MLNGKSDLDNGQHCYHEVTRKCDFLAVDMKCYTAPYGISHVITSSSKMKTSIRSEESENDEPFGFRQAREGYGGKEYCRTIDTSSLLLRFIKRLDCDGENIFGKIKYILQ